MKDKFTIEEKRKYMFKKHLKDHLIEYILDFIGPIVLTALLLYLCKAEEYIYGILLSTAYSLGKMVYNFYHYKKEYVDVDIK